MYVENMEQIVDALERKWPKQGVIRNLYEN